MEGRRGGSAGASAAAVDRDLAERRKVIKNKILAGGRMSHLSLLLRCVPCLPHVPKKPAHTYVSTK